MMIMDKILNTDEDPFSDYDLTSVIKIKPISLYTVHLNIYLFFIILFNLKLTLIAL